ncbi:outer membrane protein [Rhodobacter sp. CZR27]|uniref:outer membrane protein n=1 Tax=Rhodobacter sp. CZR27 TaxID=2033869 RepID=UPI000BBF1543|nr:hypothetical protein [Rhodobacter sp. CZR27]
MIPYTYDDRPAIYNDTMTQLSISDYTGTIGFGRILHDWGRQSLGLEIDLTAGDMASDLQRGDTAPCTRGREGCRADVNLVSTVRLVLGTTTGATMPYLTAGLAIADIEGSADHSACASSNCGFNEVRPGGVVGAGVRHEISDRWAIKGEVLYFDLGELDLGTGGYVEGYFTFSAARLGMIYKF